METPSVETKKIVVRELDSLELACPSLQALDMVMNKWTPKVLFLLQDGPLRYMQLKRQAGGSTQKMLTQTLRRLEKEGLVARTVYPTSPPTVEYALTPLGETLQAALQELYRWGRMYAEQFPSMREEGE